MRRKMHNMSNISRCLSYHAPICRPHRLLHGSCKHWKKICSTTAFCPQLQIIERLTSMPTMLRVQLYTQRAAGVFSPNTNVDMLRKRISFSGSPSNDAASASNVVPVGIIMPETNDGSQLKIVIVPLDLVNLDVESLKHTLEAIHQLRLHADEIDTFAKNMLEDFKKESESEKAPTAEKEEGMQRVNFIEGYVQGVDAVGTNASKTESSSVQQEQQELQQQQQQQEAVASLANANVSPSAPQLPNAPNKTPEPMTKPVTNPNPSTMPLGDPQENTILAMGKPEVAEQTEPVEPQVDEVSFEVSDSLSQRLNDMSIASMHLSFEMDMTNVRDAILNGELEPVPLEQEPSLGSDPMILMETRVEADSNNVPENTVPLQFNALIKGTVQIDADKLNPANLTDDQLPEYNDRVTSIAASICSSALESGFSAEHQQTQSNLANLADMKISPRASAALKRHQDVKRLIISPSLKDGCKYPIVKKKKKCPKKCPLLDDPCKETDPCKTPKKTPRKKATKTTEITASSGKGKKKDPCAKKGGDKKKKDPCAKKGGDKKKDPCAKEKKDPCAKKGDDKKKKDPCAKFKKGGDKKKDPCDKKGGDKKKKDPCAKFKKGGDKKKKDPCAKKDGDKKKKDPCAKKDGDKKKKDPCAKKKKDPCGKKDGDKKKKDPCAKFKKGGDKKKKDPCAKKGGDKKKKDPCAKKGGDKKKKDPCAKPKKDPSKKKYSTNASPVPLSRSLSTKAVVEKIRPRFKVYSTLVRRHYGGMPSKTQMSALGIKSVDVRNKIQRDYSKKKSKKDSKKENSKCNAIQNKKSPKVRKHIKARKGLRTDCYGEFQEECPKSFCKGTCSEVKFPRKKCDKSKKKAKPKMAKKPKKKLPAICFQGQKSRKSKKGKGKGKERINLLGTGPLILNQKRHLCDSAANKKRFSSIVCELDADIKELIPEEIESYPTEIVRIPTPYQIHKVQQTLPSLKPFDVLIKTSSVALSGSDIHVYENASSDMEGMTLGHDATGIVDQVGSCVHHLHVGDRVVMESALSCGICDYCKRGLYNICGELVYNGFLATYQSHPADLCHRLPDSISMEVGTLTQTLAMGCQACFKADISPTSNVLIIGTSPTAVSAAMCAVAIGAKKVTIAGTMDTSLEMINSDFGFHTIHYDTNALFGEVLEAVHCKFQEWPNCAINCSITPMTMNLAVMALQPCSVCVLAECESECASFNALDILMKNIRLIPSFRSANMYPTALQLIKSGRAPMNKFIAKVFSWSMLEYAFKSAQHESNVGMRKIIVNNTETKSIGATFRKKHRFQDQN